MIITLENIALLQNEFSVIEKRFVTGNNNVPKYQLIKDLDIQLSNLIIIRIPKGYVWDLSSVPRFLWWLLPPDGDFGIAYIIHDFLYEYKYYNRKFCDDEMLKWAKVSSGTKKISLRNIDNYTRYYAVRLFGWVVYNRNN